MSTTASRSAIPESLSSFLSEPKQLLINGQWVPAQSGRTFDVFNPASAEVIAQVAEGEAADIDAAVRAARAALEEGPLLQRV